MAVYDGGQVEWGVAIAVAPGGKLVVAGNTYGAASPSDYDVLALRFNGDGTPDSSFGANGAVKFDGGYTDRSSGLAVQPDGKVIVVGDSYKGFDSAHGYDTNENALIIRFDNDGQLDSTFNSHGVVLYNGGNRDTAQDVAIQPDGKIVVAGGTGGALLALRFDNNGTLDQGFGTGGVATYPESLGLGLALQADEKIFIAGCAYPSGRRSMAVRLDSRGNLDDTFGEKGVITFPQERGAQSCAVLPGAALW